MADHASSIQAVGLRVTRLTTAGAPITGSKLSWTTNQFIKLSFTPEYESGEDIVQKAADGTLCVTYKTKDVLKRVNFSLEMCNPEPEITQILNGGDLLAPAGQPTNIIGYASPQVGEVTTPDGLGIEIWSKAIVAGRPASVNPYWWWVFPYVQCQQTGDRVAENGLMANVFEGWGVGNSLFAGGPDGLWPFSTAKPYQFARTSLVPAITNAAS